MELVVGGTPVSSGVAVGRVVLAGNLARYAAPPDRAILVASSASPALWSQGTNLAAVIVERGGALSALGTVARELGVVAVFGARCVLSLLREGELVLADGWSGAIYRLDEREATLVAAGTTCARLAPSDYAGASAP